MNRAPYVAHFLQEKVDRAMPWIERQRSRMSTEDYNDLVRSDETLCGSVHPKRNLVCDLQKGHERGHACYPPRWQEPTFWRSA